MPATSHLQVVFLVLAAVVLATPLAYAAMNRCLEAFAYRIGILWWIFLGAGLAALAIALLIVSYRSIKAALADPVKSLRHEETVPRFCERRAWRPSPHCPRRILRY